MNKSIVIACMLLSLHCLAQKKKDFSGTVIRPFGVHVTGMDQFAEDRPKGSPYIQPMFSQAKVENVEANANMRYNAYSDEFEFLNSKNDTLVLDKIEDFNAIVFLGSNKKYKLVDYTNFSGKFVHGYLVEVYQKAGCAYYKKETVSFYAGKKAKTSLERDMPAKFNKDADSYYLKDKNGKITEFPESKRQLSKLFPDKKDAIEAFVKENKIDFDADAGRIKIVDFLAAL